jgi:hypothetical protein
VTGVFLPKPKLSDDSKAKAIEEAMSWFRSYKEPDHCDEPDYSIDFETKAGISLPKLNGSKQRRLKRRL